MSPPDICPDAVENEGPMIKPDIPEFFRGQNVLITGATGFMGKVLVEKLLRSCPDVGVLYLLMRPKRGQQPEQRLKELVQCKVFSKVRGERGEDVLLRQLRAVEGDVSKPGLGLTPSARAQLARHVTLVFHAAATVRFDEPLRNAVLLNTRGTREMIALARDMPHLKAMVHVSTMFSNCDQPHILEQVYPCNAEPDRLIQCAEWMDDKWMDTLTPMLIEGRPNTYVYTKNLAEKLAADAAKSLPIAIFRPSIVMSTLNEPEPGWLDNLNGPSVVILSGGNGMLKHMLAHVEKIAHVAPADLAINAIITLAWYLANYRPSECEVFNFTPPEGYGLKWGTLLKSTLKLYKDYPYSMAMSMPSLNLTRSVFTVALSHAYLLAWAKLTDFFTAITGHKKRLGRLQEKVNNAIESLQYFTTHAWTVDTSNVSRLLHLLSAQDSKTFNFDLSKISWEQYVYDYGLGIRRHILKENDSTVPDAKKRLVKLKWINRVATTMLFLFIYKLIVAPFLLAPSVNDVVVIPALLSKTITANMTL